MARPRVADGENSLQIWSGRANVLNKESRIVSKGWSSSLKVGPGGNNSPEKIACYEILHTQILRNDLHNGK